MTIPESTPVEAAAELSSRLGIVSGPLPAVISVVTLVLLLACKIDRAAQERIAAQLAARRSAAHDSS